MLITKFSLGIPRRNSSFIAFLIHFYQGKIFLEKMFQVALESSNDDGVHFFVESKGLPS